MRKYDESDAEDVEYTKKMGVPQWMLDLVASNSGYVHWGNGEVGFYSKNKDPYDWKSSITVNNVKDLIVLDDLNECVNFYFQVSRDSIPCDECAGRGLTKEYALLWDSFTDSDPYVGWRDKITQAELDDLINKGCFERYLSTKAPGYKLNVQEVNDANRKVGADLDSGLDHVGSMNQVYLVESRAQSFGIVEKCSDCHGDGSFYTDAPAKLQLQTWMIHPRKGVSRAMLLTEIKQEELPAVMTWLKKARDSFVDKFDKFLK